MDSNSARKAEITFSLAGPVPPACTGSAAPIDAPGPRTMRLADRVMSAAAEWLAWEDAVISAESNGSPGSYSARVDEARLAFVRICSHYFSNGAFLADDELLRGAGRLAGIPGVLIHGRSDIGGPPITPWELARAWPDAELIVVADSGHTGSPAFNAAARAGADRLYTTITGSR